MTRTSYAISLPYSFDPAHKGAPYTFDGVHYMNNGEFIETLVLTVGEVFSDTAVDVLA